MGLVRQPQSSVAIESSSADGVVYSLKAERSSETKACVNPVHVVARTFWATAWVTRFPGGPVCVPGAGPDDGAGVDGVVGVVGVVGAARVEGVVPEESVGGVLDAACDGATSPVAGPVVVVELLAIVGGPFSA